MPEKDKTMSEEEKRREEINGAIWNYMCNKNDLLLQAIPVRKPVERAPLCRVGYKAHTEEHSAYTELKNDLVLTRVDVIDDDFSYERGRPIQLR